MKPTTSAVLAALLSVMAACNNERQQPQQPTSDTNEPNPQVQNDKTPDTGTGGPVPETPKDDDQQTTRSPSN